MDNTEKTPYDTVNELVCQEKERRKEQKDIQKEQLRRHKLRLMKELISDSLLELGKFGDRSHQKLANVLNVPIEDFGLSIYKQLIWSWASGLALPNPKIFNVMAKVAEEDSLPKRFADRVLEILAMRETSAQRDVKELGYD